MYFRNIKNKLLISSDRRLFFLLLLVFSFMCGSDLDYAIYMDMSVFEYILYVLTDHYYMVYAWMFFLVLRTAQKGKENQAIERFRYRSLKRYYRINNIAKSLELFGIIMAHGMIAFVLGIWKLPICNEFRATVSYGITDSNLDVITYYAGYVRSPVWAIVLVLAYWIIGSIFMETIVFYCHEIWGRRGLFGSLLFILVSTMSGFMTSMDEGAFGWLFLNNYYILHHPLLIMEDMKEIPVIFNLLLMVCVLILFQKIAVTKNSNAKITELSKILMHGHPVLCFAFFTALVILGPIGMAEKWDDIYGIVFSLFKGFSYQNFQLTEFLYYLAVPVFLLFFVNAAWERQRNNYYEQIMFRCGSRMRWNACMKHECIRFLAKSYAVYIGLSGMMFWSCLIIQQKTQSSCLKELVEYYGISKRYVIYAFAASLVIRFLELLLLYNIDRLFYEITSNTTVSYVITFLFYVPGIFLRNIRVLPLGYGSVYQILEICTENTSSYTIFIIMMISIFIILLDAVNKKNFCSIRRASLWLR